MRKFSESQKHAILQHITIHGYTATLKKFNLSSSVIVRWRRKYGQAPNLPAATAPNNMSFDEFVKLQRAYKKFISSMNQ